MIKIFLNFVNRANFNTFSNFWWRGCQICHTKSTERVVRVRYALPVTNKKYSAVHSHCQRDVKGRQKMKCRRVAHSTQKGRILEAMSDKVIHTSSRKLVPKHNKVAWHPCPCPYYYIDGHSEQTSIDEAMQNAVKRVKWYQNQRFRILTKQPYLETTFFAKISKEASVGIKCSALCMDLSRQNQRSVQRYSCTAFKYPICLKIVRTQSFRSST